MQKYFDNAATSFPKPREVIDSIIEFHNECGASPGRGAYSRAKQATDILDECRELLCILVNAPSPSHCIFTQNCSDALNLSIGGVATHWIEQGKPVHIITTAMDHNSVLRPLHALQKRGIEFTVIPADSKTGIVSPKDIEKAITSDTRLVAVAHGSNVTGTIQNIASIGRICNDIPFLVDAAQTMGHTPIDIEAMQIDLLAFPGHKGLLGPSGTGGLIIKPSMEPYLSPIRFGGTGNKSESPYQPETLPEKYEIGSHNILGIVGLRAGIKWILKRGVAKLHDHELQLCNAFIEQCQSIHSIDIVGPQTAENRCGVFSITDWGDPHDLAHKIERNSGCCVRAGLHCAPFTHETMGTAKYGGTVRCSFGPFHTTKDVQHFAEALKITTLQEALA